MSRGVVIPDQQQKILILMHKQAMTGHSALSIAILPWIQRHRLLTVMLLMPKMMKRTICTTGWSFFANLLDGYAAEDTKHLSQAFCELRSFLFFLVSIIWLSDLKGLKILPMISFFFFFFSVFFFPSEPLF